MALKKKPATFVADQLQLPKIKTGKKVTGVVVKHVDQGALIDCENTFTGIILSKEVRSLRRNNMDLSVGVTVEAEILNIDLVSEEGYVIISVTKLLQQDVRKKILALKENDEIFTVTPVEANLGGLICDMHGIKGFIPLSQLGPINYPRVEDGDQEKIFELLLGLIGKEIKVRIVSFDDDGRRMVLSEREAFREVRTEILSKMNVGDEYDGVVTGVSSYGFFVTIQDCIEGLVHISEITYGHVSQIDRLYELNDKMKVKIIGLEDGKISLSAKQLKPDPWSIIPQKYNLGDIIEGEVVRYVPYGVFIRVFDDINGLVHLSEISDAQGNPTQMLRLGQVVKAKIILIEPHNRKIGLSIRALDPNYKPEEKRQPRRFVKKTTTDVATTDAPVSESSSTDVEAPKAKTTRKAKSEETADTVATEEIAE